MVSAAYINENQNNEVYITHKTLEKYNTGTICLSGGMKGAIANFVLHGQNDKAVEELKLNSIFNERLYIEIQRHGSSR